MLVKVENRSGLKLPKKTEETIQGVLGAVPREHLRGLSRVVLVDRIIPDSRVQLPQAMELPGLYHPRQGGSQPFLEIALNSLLLPTEGLFKRLAARLNFRASLAYLTLSLQAQHYHFTLSHGLKKHQYEGAIRSYVEKHLETWRESQVDWRVKLFKPLRPFLEKWSRKLKKKYDAEKRKS
ncbi:MAG TPA: hypothetical protein PKC13_33020 [Blastocatellia bacterium]|nr:hypothetical protein [Blastocatellia bacterium]HMV85103.1 hypothetical protein [Blastocatellia bacterium]HMX30448.1 hypothetical protein [Blastocatellia bacterium]HMY75733.1 hypothetical protein [Blastocatellia bacterium]HNG28335.1 hypothetical protein [Blastocatellia bacterium]